MNLEQMTLPLVFLSGILGSAHCIGMCGGISATMSLGASRISSAMLRQLAWSCGRIFTYSFLGILAATLGIRIIRSGSSTVSAQAIFAIVAGTLLILQGMHSAGWLRFRARRNLKQPCLTAGFLAQFLQGGSTGAAFIAGVLTGFLPCGLVYSFLALAASSGNVLHGLVIMAAFGAGTVPVMVATGTGFSMASVSVRRQLIKVAAVCVLMTGMMTVGRGIAFASAHRGKMAAQSCPLCTSQTEKPMP